MEWIKRLHTSLLLPQWGGRQLAGWMGVGLLLLTVLGIPLWWPNAGPPGRWRDAFTVPRAARGVRLHRRLHGALGIWVSVMLLVTSVTGITLGFPQTSRAALGIAPNGPAPGGEGRVREGGVGEALDLDAAIALGLRAAPGTVLRAALLPGVGGGPVRLLMGPPGSEGVAAVTTVLVDAAGTAVRSVQPPDRVSAAERVLRWAHDLHYGQGFGPVWRGLTVLVGLALPAFGVTGVSLWWLKRRNRRRVGAMRVAAMGGASQVGR